MRKDCQSVVAPLMKPERNSVRTADIAEPEPEPERNRRRADTERIQLPDKSLAAPADSPDKTDSRPADCWADSPDSPAVCEIYYQ